jgi:hypothetical protein
MVFSDGTNVAATLHLRLVLFTPTGHVLCIEIYVEATACLSRYVHVGLYILQIKDRLMRIQYPSCIRSGLGCGETDGIRDLFAGE